MMSRRLHTLVPTLVLLGALPGAMFAATAGSATERDSQFEAVKSLIDREYRLPAKRQLEDFTKAGHADAEWYNKVLTWFYADRFRVSSPDAAEKSALGSQAAALERELKAADQASKLPPMLHEMISGSGQILRLVNDILRTLNPDSPEPILGPKQYSEEQRASLNQAVKALVEASNAAWAASLVKIKANAKNDENALGGDQKDVKIQKLLELAVDIRLEAVRPLFLARKALREVAERGDQFGLDPAPAREALNAFVTKNFELLQDWDYNWGDYHAYLHAFIMDLASDSVRFKLKKAVFDEVEADLMKTVAMDVDKEFGSGPIAEEIRTLQVRTWGNIFTWYRDLGREVDPKNWQRGTERWEEFKELTKKSHFRLDHRNPDRAQEVGRAYMNAGRLFLAKGDKRAAQAAFSAVAGTRGNPLAGNAQEWIARSGGGKAGGADSVDWGSQPMAEEPSAVLATANAYLRTAGTLSDPAQARGMLMTAAVSLRNGILGLSNANFAETADEIAPEMWFRYAYVLGKLDMRWHAALASQEGLRQIKARLAELRNANPWKSREGKWTTAGSFVGKLAKNSIIYAQNLLQRSRGAGVSALFDETVTLVNVVCPEEGGKNIDRIQVIIRIQDGEYDGAVELARSFQKKYPDSFYDGASLINTARIAKFQGATDASEIKRSGDEMLADANSVAKRAKEEMAKATDPEQKRTLRRAIREVQRLTAIILNKQGKSAEVLAMLDAGYWANPPADEEESATMLRIMCYAALDYYKSRVKDEAAKRDPAVLLADWPKFEGAYTIWRSQKARLTSQAEAVERMGNSLGTVFQSIPFQVRFMREQKGAPAELAAIETAANRAFADLIEPRLDSDSKPDLALYVGNVLWDLDEHARAVRLFEIFLASIAKDAEVSALRDAPKDVLAPLDAVLNARPELRQKWAEVRDLLVDDPQLTEKILTLDLPADQWGEKKRDFFKAVVAIRALRAEAVKARVTLGASFATIDNGLDNLEKTAAQLGREIAVVGNLAVAYGELGRKEKANALYERLIAYDPTDPTFLAAAVELTLDQLKAGKKFDDKEIEATQVKAAKVRKEAPEGSTTYWLAKIQVLELCAFLKDTKSIDSSLNFDDVNQTTPAETLQLLPRQSRDDKRARRARNVQAVELCRRYLEVFKVPGVTTKPSFAISAVEIDGKQVAVFTPVDGPTFVAHKRELDDGSIVWFLWEADKEPPKEPEPEPEPAPAPVQPDKAQEKKP